MFERVYFTLLILYRMPFGGEGDAFENGTETDIQQHLVMTRQQTSKSCNKETIDSPDADISVSSDKTKLNQRCSNRLTKRAKKELSAQDVSKNIVPELEKQISAPISLSKTRRPWELWSVEDKNAFFEALCEFGKDFENIQSYIAQRSKKKGVAANMIKNKDQVRHFYYRTWHKISKFLEISDSVRKQTQELYGLINYAELRKKIGGCLNEKNRQKLNELVFSGTTTIKHKGKKLRIKTPVCRALKKLNHVADTKEPDTDKLPKEITVEFRPYTNSSWLYVQNLAQNPRVRIKVSLQKKLKSVIEYLQKRWKPYRLKRKEHILSSLPNPVCDLVCDKPPLLRVKPFECAKIYPLLLSSIDVASSSDVCLEKHLKLSDKSLCQDMKTKKTFCLNQKIQDDKQNENIELSGEKFVSTSDNAVECIENFHQSDVLEQSSQRTSKNSIDEGYLNVLTPPKSVPEILETDGQRPTSLLSSMLESTSRKNSLPEDFSENNVEVPPEINFRTFESITNKQRDKKDNGESEKTAQNNNENDAQRTKNDSVINGKGSSIKPDSTKEEDSSSSNESVYLKIIRNGWTSDEAGYLTFGELYLLLGKPSSIVLQYEFETCGNSDDKLAHNENRPVLNKVLEVANTLFTENKNKQIMGKLRMLLKVSKPKTPVGTEKTQKEVSPVAASASTTNRLAPVKEELNKKKVTVKENISKKIHMNTLNNALENHIFAKPIGTAPRQPKPQIVKHQTPTAQTPAQSKLKEELGKLLPHTRRGCRVRRKPLVVQRPLLPREGMPRPMTLLHIVPSISSLTTVLPSNCASENKMTIPPPKKVVQILPQGSLQVPIVKQVCPEPAPKLIFPPSTVTVPHVLLKTASKSPIKLVAEKSMPYLSSSNSTASSTTSSSTTKEPSLDTDSVGEDPLTRELSLPVSSDLEGYNLDFLSESPRPSLQHEEELDAMQDLSLLQESNINFTGITPALDTSFLEELGIDVKSKTYDTNGLDTPDVTNFMDDSLTAAKSNSSMSSSAQQSFRAVSPEMQWLNGEVDSQVRCLLDECSIDFITKFEDLADVINN